MSKLKWIYKGCPADPGYWDSADGRFSINPVYYGTARAQGYQLRDNLTGRTNTHDTVRLAKELAELEGVP